MVDSQLCLVAWGHTGALFLLFSILVGAWLVSLDIRGLSGAMWLVEKREGREWGGLRLGAKELRLGGTYRIWGLVHSISIVGTRDR